MKFDFSSGWIGGAVCVAATHPLDTLQVRMQTTSRYHANVSYAQILQQITKASGIKGLYRGILPPVAFRGVSMGMNRFAYNVAEKYFTGKQQPLKGKNLALTGAFAGFWMAFSDHCMYLVKSKAQTSKSKDFTETFRSYWKMGCKITRTEGFKGWRRGFVPGAAMLMITYPIFYLQYDWMREKECNAALAGSVAAVCCWPFGMPFDTLRVRMQCSHNQETISRTAKELLRQPIKRWFVGLGATLARAGPQMALCMYSIEASNKYLNLYFDGHGCE